MHSYLTPGNPPSLPSLMKFNSFSVTSSLCGNSRPISRSQQIKFIFPLPHVRVKGKQWHKPGSVRQHPEPNQSDPAGPVLVA